MSFYAKGTHLHLTRGDYGIPLPIQITSHCASCRDSLLDGDEILLEISKGDRVYVSRRKAWEDLRLNDGVMVLELTQAESESLELGLYTWQIYWLRGQEIRCRLLRSLLEVVV